MIPSADPGLESGLMIVQYLAALSHEISGLSQADPGDRFLSDDVARIAEWCALRWFA